MTELMDGKSNLSAPLQVFTCPLNKPMLMGKNINSSIVYFEQGYLDLNGSVFQGYFKACKNHDIRFMVGLWWWRSLMNVASIENTFISDVSFPRISAKSPSPFYTFKK
jgi:hypothetical protein